MKSATSKNIRRIIKAQMKNRGLKYKDLAAELGLSESSVKRVLNNEDLSIERLSRICEWLGIKLSDLIVWSESGDSSELAFTAEQDKFLASHPKAAYLYLRICINESLEEFSSETDTPLATNIAMAEQLQSLGLVKIGPNNRCTAKFIGPFHWQPKGYMVKKYSFPFAKAIFDHFYTEPFDKDYRNINSPGHLVWPFEFYGSQEVNQDFADELKKLIAKYRKQANTSIALESKQNIGPISGLICVGPFNAWKRVMQPSEK